DRRRGAGSVSIADPHRGHHPGARIGPWPGAGDEAGPEDGQGPIGGAVPVRARRQGRGKRRQSSGAFALMTARIDRRFAALKAENRPALVTFVMAGDPDLAVGQAILDALPQAGADVIELGMPFSDP